MNVLVAVVDGVFGREGTCGGAIFDDEDATEAAVATAGWLAGNARDAACCGMDKLRRTNSFKF